ncbi:MAG: DUF1592 domain-containing protein [Akkermansiaceae bacterium]
MSIFFNLLGKKLCVYSAILCAVSALSFESGFAASIPKGTDGYKSHIAPFFEQNCVKCHGPEKSKGKITVHSLDGDLSAGQELERWELIIDVLEHGEMPPEDEERQPTDEERAAVIAWIEGGLRDYVTSASKVAKAPTVRRLTNFEYQNTMRDLFGFELNLIKDLPEDPLKPYHFNNTAKMMLIGTEQMDRYEDAARRMLASAIVNPEKPKVHQTRKAWNSSPASAQGLMPDEIGIVGNRRGTAADGMQVREWPKTGEFKIRFKASAILPEAYSQVPLRIGMGYDRSGNTAGLIEPVGTVTLQNNVDHPEIFEMRGRIENYPTVPEHRYRRGGKIDGNLVIIPPHITVTPLNIFDDGRMQDQEDPLTRPRAAVEWIEFEAPVADVWPPKHHSRILFDSPLRESDPEAYLRQVLERFMTRAFRRPVKSDEVDRFVRVYNIVAEQLSLDTKEDIMRETLTMVLVSPDFLYHVAAKEDENRHYEIASKLSYFLWGSMPDQELFDLAEAKQLQDPEIIDQQVRRLIQDDRSKGFVKNFTEQWLSIDKMRTIPINLDLFPRFLYTYGGGEKTGREIINRPTIRDYMMDETSAFIAELIDRNESLFNIIDSDFAMLNQPLAAHYGVEGVEGLDLRRVPIKPDHQLGGLLTHGSVLLGNGTGTAPHPIYRAVWLREAILGDKVKDPPADVPALTDTVGESAEKATRIKDLLRQHREKESCADCHVRLDPWGIPFERYNAIGQYEPYAPAYGTKVRRFDKRTYVDLASYNEYLESLKTEKVDAVAKVPHGPEVDGVPGLKKFLIKDREKDIVENVVRRLLTYGLGRELTYHDRYVVEGLMKQSKNKSYKLQDLIVSVCQDDLFTGKKPQQ